LLAPRGGQDSRLGFVLTDEHGKPLTVRYEQLVPLLLNEIQELRASNEELLALVEALEQEAAD
jgi:hypothetical protein